MGAVAAAPHTTVRRACRLMLNGSWKAAPAFSAHTVPSKRAAASPRHRAPFEAARAALPEVRGRLGGTKCFAAAPTDRRLPLATRPRATRRGAPGSARL